MLLFPPLTGCRNIEHTGQSVNHMPSVLFAWPGASVIELVVLYGAIFNVSVRPGRCIAMQDRDQIFDQLISGRGDVEQRSLRLMNGVMDADLAKCDSMTYPIRQAP